MSSLFNILVSTLVSTITSWQESTGSDGVWLCGSKKKNINSIWDPKPPRQCVWGVTVALRELVTCPGCVSDLWDQLQHPLWPGLGADECNLILVGRGGLEFTSVLLLSDSQVWKLLFPYLRLLFLPHSFFFFCTSCPTTRKNTASSSS